MLGETKGDEDLGGYHLVWPRDLVEAAGGLLALGAVDEARRILEYLRATQNRPLLRQTARDCCPQRER